VRISELRTPRNRAAGLTRESKWIPDVGTAATWKKPTSGLPWVTEAASTTGSSRSKAGS